MTAFCPHCWAEVAPGTQVCPHCHTELAAGAGDYLAKLIAALEHPEPLTRRRAAYVLGLLRDPGAVEALAAVLAGPADPYVKGEAAHALRAIGGERARDILRGVARDETQSVMVRRIAAAALSDGDPTAEGEDN